METEVKNNKELVPLEHYLEVYACADPEHIQVRTGLPYDREKKTFEAVYLGRRYEITWPSFEIAALDQQEGYSPLLQTNQSKILMIRFLLEGSALSSTGKFLTYREIPWGEVYYRQFNGRCMMRLAFSYGNKLPEYRRRMELLGAKRIAASEAGYEIEIFPGYAVQFLLWAGDEEFPPAAQILFSDNFAAAFHAEDLVVVAEVIIGALKHIS